MEEIKKIIAKAAYGQNAKVFSKGIDLSTYERKRPTQILGCIITDAEISGCSFEGNVENGKAVRVNINFDTHLWYSLGSDTKVAKIASKFTDVVTIFGKGAELYSDEEARAFIKQAPMCTGTSIVDGSEGACVRAQVEYELGAEIIGQTTLNVKVIHIAGGEDSAEEVPPDDNDDVDEFEDD